MANLPTGGQSNSGGPPTGANLPAPPLPGSVPQPAVPGKPPGFAPIHFAIVQTFIAGQDPATITDAIVASIIKAAERLTDSLLAAYPGYLPGGITLPINIPQWSRDVRIAPK